MNVCPSNLHLAVLLFWAGLTDFMLVEGVERVFISHCLPFDTIRIMGVIMTRFVWDTHGGGEWRCVLLGYLC